MSQLGPFRLKKDPIAIEVLSIDGGGWKKAFTERSTVLNRR